MLRKSSDINDASEVTLSTGRGEMHPLADPSKGSGHFSGSAGRIACTCLRERHASRPLAFPCGNQKHENPFLDSGLREEAERKIVWSMARDFPLPQQVVRRPNVNVDHAMLVMGCSSQRMPSKSTGRISFHHWFKSRGLTGFPRVLRPKHVGPLHRVRVRLCRSPRRVFCREKEERRSKLLDMHRHAPRLFCAAAGGRVLFGISLHFVGRSRWVCDSDVSAVSHTTSFLAACSSGVPATLLHAAELRS